MSGKFTIVQDSILGRLTYDEDATNYEDPDLAKSALETDAFANLPANLGQLPREALLDLHKQHQAQADDEHVLKKRLDRKFEIHDKFAADCKKGANKIQNRLVARQDILTKLSLAIKVKLEAGTLDCKMSVSLHTDLRSNSHFYLH